MIIETHPTLPRIGTDLNEHPTLPRIGTDLVEQPFVYFVRLLLESDLTTWRPKPRRHRELRLSRFANDF